MKSIPDRLKVKKVLVALTVLEADLIRIIREHKYGQGRFKVNEGQPYQLFFEESKILCEQGGLDIEGSLIITPGQEDVIINKLVLTIQNEKER